MMKRAPLHLGLLCLLLCAWPALAGDGAEAEVDSEGEASSPEVPDGEGDEVEPDPAPAPLPDPLALTLPVSELLWQLGEEKPSHWVEPTEQRVKQGREIVLEGRTTDDSGKPNRVQSPAYLCTDCHHVVREDPDLSVSDPEARLDYAVANDLTFLPGTTLWGTVNRES